MSGSSLTYDVAILQSIADENLIAAFAMSDVIDQNHSTFMVISKRVDPKTKHTMVTLVNISDPDWEETIDLNDINVYNDAEISFEVGGVFQFYKDEEQKVVSISESYFNKTEVQRFENIYDYITFYLQLHTHSKSEIDDGTINYAIIQGAYTLCQICGQMQFKNSPMCENGKTEMKNKIEDSTKQIKSVLFREEQGKNFFYDLSIKTLNCLEDVDNYYQGRDETKALKEDNDVETKTM